MEFNVLLDTIVGYEIPELYLFYDLFTIDYKLIVTATETVTNEVFLYEYELDNNILNYHSIIDTGGLINQWPMIISDLPDKNAFHLYLFDVYKTICKLIKLIFNKYNFLIITHLIFNHVKANFKTLIIALILLLGVNLTCQILMSGSFLRILKLVRMRPNTELSNYDA
ncbi:MAG: hypothetical protein R2759_09255 [Bacteroidales bacterium]